MGYRFIFTCRAFITWTARLPAFAATVALVAAILSQFPSSLPRPWYAQAILTGTSVLICYFAALPADVLVRYSRWRDTRLVRFTRRGLRWSQALLLLTAAPLTTFASLRWDARQRGLLRLGPAQPTEVLALATSPYLVIAALLASRCAWQQFQTRSYQRLDPLPLPGWVARAVAPVGTLLMVSLLLTEGIGPAAAALINDQARSAEESFDPDRVAPTIAERSGSPWSLVKWDQLNREGRRFVTRGPDAAAISRFQASLPDSDTQVKSASQPIRVYSALSTSVRRSAAQVVAELDRTGAWQRSALLLVIPTGTGWVDADLATAFELTRNGDTAIAAIPYSYQPSWIAYLFHRQTAVDAARALISAVHTRWVSLPADQRPELYLAGVSLGAFGAQEVFGNLNELCEMFSGAVFAGTPNGTPMWKRVTAARDAGSTQLLPTVSSQPATRFIDGHGSPGTPASARVVFVQHGSDAIVWWSPDLLFRRPDWLAESRGVDVLPSTVWLPVISFLQLTVDFGLCGMPALPRGTGHSYGPEYADAFATVAAPPGWTAADTTVLRTALTARDPSIVGQR